MNNSNAKFLPDPPSLRKAIVELSSGTNRLDLAVAFVRPEWERLLGSYPGSIRVICWLGNPATDPYAVESMRVREDLLVKQREGLHTKVYLVPGVGAIVGSANLSCSALGGLVGHRQDEAAIRVTDQMIVKEIGIWFEELWNDPDTKEISDANLEKAKEDFKKWPIQKVNKLNQIPPLPEPLPVEITNLTQQVQGIDLMEEFRKEHDELSATIAKEKLHRSDISKLADLIASWTGHRAVYKTFETQPPARTLQGLRTLLDERIGIQERLQRIKEHSLLPGLQIPSMSLLLYWYRPDAYPPFNGKTKRFLKDFKMESPGMSASSPACYSTWLGFTDLLRTRLQLSSAGHIDRIVSLYYASVSKIA
jgi:hypothetical protein